MHVSGNKHLITSCQRKKLFATTPQLRREVGVKPPPSNPHGTGARCVAEFIDEGGTSTLKKCQVSREKMTPLNLCSGGLRFILTVIKLLSKTPQ